MAYQSRRWVFVNNTPEQGEDYALVLEHFSYLAYGVEKAPTTGHVHHQGYCVLAKKATRAGVSKIFLPVNKTIHVGDKNGKPCSGTHEQNIEYISKDGQVTVLKDEYQGEQGGRPKREKWDDALAYAIQGDFENIDPQIQITQFQNLRRLHAERRTAEDLSGPCGVWIYGPPGTGKSTLARAMPTDTPDLSNSSWLEGLQGGEQPPPTIHPYFEKEPNQWWDTYADEPKVILDDLDMDSSRGLDRFMKIWCDQYAFKPEIKHGALGKIRPKLVIVTSQYSPQELFDVATVLALRRRCALIRTYVEGSVRMEYMPPDIAVIARTSTSSARPMDSVVSDAELDTFLFPEDFFT